jgi:FMN phosphatase YigB (HAD superfamily)
MAPIKIKYVVFDLEGTLLTSPPLNEKVRALAFEMIEHKLAITPTRAREMFDAATEELRNEINFAPPLTLVLVAMGIDLAEWERFNTDRWHASELIVRDRRLKAKLTSLSRHYLLAVFSNLNEAQTRQALQALGVLECFQQVFSPTAPDQVKPSVTLLRRITAFFHGQPEEFLIVGDRSHVDLEPARMLGMATRLVAGPEDVLNMNVEEATS